MWADEELSLIGDGHCKVVSGQCVVECNGDWLAVSERSTAGEARSRAERTV